MEYMFFYLKRKFAFQAQIWNGNDKLYVDSIGIVVIEI